jgi:hypothetical protein
MHISQSVLVAHSSFIEGSHTTKNMASEWAKLHPFGYFFGYFLMVKEIPFWQNVVTKLVTFWANFYFSNFLHIHLNMQFQNMVWCIYLEVSKVV